MEDWDADLSPCNFATTKFPAERSSFITLYIGDLKITSASIERQKRSQNLAPVLVIISGKSLVFSRKLITSTDFYRYCAPDASAPVLVINQSPRKGWFRKRVVLANVPSFRFSFRGNMQTYPRCDFRSGGTSERTLVPVFVPGEHPNETTFFQKSA